MKPAAESAPMSWQVSYCLDFGFCFNYPKEYWLGYFRTLHSYGCNAVMLWVGGVMPTPGYDQTLAWRCDYVPEIVDYLHSLDMRVHLMVGVYGWLGMSPGLISMYPEIEITWSEERRKAYPMDSTRRGICPTRGRDMCLDYAESLYKACPEADGMALEAFCEKPHCECEACRERGLWRIELEFLHEIGARLWRINPAAEIIWPFGYEITHGQHPESLLYDEMAKLDEPRFIWWQTRIKQGYTDRGGERHEWMDPDELGRFAPRLLVPPGGPEVFKVARQAGALGVASATPAGRYMFLPEADPRHFGYFVEAPEPRPPMNSHALFQLRALRIQSLMQRSDWTPEIFQELVAETFFDPQDTASADLAGHLLFLEDLVLGRRVCAWRSAERLWSDIDGGANALMGKLEPGDLDRLRAIAALPKRSIWVGDMISSASALLELAGA